MDEPEPGWKLLVLLMIGVFMGALDLTILAPALPAIAGSFSVTPAAVVLAFSIYAAFYAASVPLMSKLSDVKGYRPVYTWSLVLFTAGSVGAAVAPSLPVLVVARLLQGVGGGGLFPVAQAIAGAVYPERRQGRIFGLLLGVFAIGGVLGPNLGGFLVQHASWQWIFWINVPLGVFGLILATQTPLPDARRDAAIDWIGVLLVIWTFGALVLAIESLRHLPDLGFFHPRIAGLLVAAIGGGLVLYRVEKSRREPILDVRLIATGTIAPPLAVSFLIGYALLSAVVLTPLFVQLRFSASELGSGAILNAAAVGLGVSAWIAAAFTNRVGSRLLVILGMLSSAVGIGVMVALAHSLYGILSGLIFLGLGLGLAQGPLSQLSLALAPPGDQGQVAGLVTVMRSMGAATGITAAGVFLTTAARRIPRMPQTEGLQDLDVDAWGSSVSLQALREAPIGVQEAVRGMLADGIIHGWYFALGAAALGLLVALRLRNHSVNPKDVAMRIVFMGTPDFAVPSLERLVADGYRPVAVVTGPDKPRGRGRQLSPTPVKEAALQLGIDRVLQPESVKSAEFASEVAELAPDLIVVVAFRILPPEVFSAARLGAFNLHGSLLPRYRGAAPIHRAVMAGETETGVTTFFLRETVDTGNVILRRPMSIGPDETTGEVHDRMMLLGADAVVETVRLIESGGVRPEPQDDTQATPAPKIHRNDAMIPWSRPATVVHNHIRGLSPHPGAWTTWDGRIVKVYRTRIATDIQDAPGVLVASNDRLFVACGEGGVEIVELQLEGRKRVGGGEFLRGHQIADGSQFT